MRPSPINPQVASRCSEVEKSRCAREAVLSDFPRGRARAGIMVSCESIQAYNPTEIGVESMTRKGENWRS